MYRAVAARGRLQLFGGLHAVGVGIAVGAPHIAVTVADAYHLGGVEIGEDTHHHGVEVGASAHEVDAGLHDEGVYLVLSQTGGG